MVAAECDETRVVLPVGCERHEHLASHSVVAQGRERRAMQERPVALLNLSDGVFVIVPAVNGCEHMVKGRKTRS